MLTDKELIAINDADHTQPLSPFIRTSQGSPSFGLSCHGYDIRLSNEFYTCVEQPYIIIDPQSSYFKEDVEKCFNKYTTESIIIRPKEFILAASLERFNIPEDVAMELKDKSTLARLGLQVFNTISEASWSGILVIEIFNNSSNKIRLRSGMAIGQAVFHKLSSKPCVTYKDRRGKYMNQGNSDNQITLAK